MARTKEPEIKCESMADACTLLDKANDLSREASQLLEQSRTLAFKAHTWIANQQLRAELMGKRTES